MGNLALGRSIADSLGVLDKLSQSNLLLPVSPAVGDSFAGGTGNTQQGKLFCSRIRTVMNYRHIFIIFGEIYNSWWPEWYALEQPHLQWHPNPNLNVVFLSKLLVCIWPSTHYNITVVACPVIWYLKWLKCYGRGNETVCDKEVGLEGWFWAVKGQSNGTELVVVVVVVKCCTRG